MGDGPPCFRRDFTCPAVLRIHSGENEISITGLLPSLAGLSRPLHLFHSFVTPYRVSYNPKSMLLVWAIPVSLAATQGIAFAFSSSGYLDVSVPRVCLLITYGFSYGYDPLRHLGSPIRISLDQCSLTAPQSVSALVPSFFDSLCQGIHRTPLLT